MDSRKHVSGLLVLLGMVLCPVVAQAGDAKVAVVDTIQASLTLKLNARQAVASALDELGVAMVPLEDMDHRGCGVHRVRLLSGFVPAGRGNPPSSRRRRGEPGPGIGCRWTFAMVKVGARSVPTARTASCARRSSSRPRCRRG